MALDLLISIIITMHGCNGQIHYSGPMDSSFSPYATLIRKPLLVYDALDSQDITHRILTGGIYNNLADNQYGQEPFKRFILQ
jgi:hypothetical protein